MKTLNNYLKKFSLYAKKENDTLFVFQDNNLELVIHLQNYLPKKGKFREGIICKKPIEFSKIFESMFDFYYLIKEDKEIGKIIVNEIYP